jgi:hypothetical protein
MNMVQINFLYAGYECIGIVEVLLHPLLTSAVSRQGRFISWQKATGNIQIGG